MRFQQQFVLNNISKNSLTKIKVKYVYVLCMWYFRMLINVSRMSQQPQRFNLIFFLGMLMHALYPKLKILYEPLLIIV